MGRERYFTRDIENDRRGFYFEIPMAAPSFNHVWLSCGRGGARRLSQEAKDFYNLARHVILGKSMPDDWESCCVRISVAPRQKSGDVDNRIKATLDALTKCLFWKDDRVVASVTCAFEKPRKQGLTRILITRGGEKFPYFEETNNND